MDAFQTNRAVLLASSVLALVEQLQK